MSETTQKKAIRLAELADVEEQKQNYRDDFFQSSTKRVSKGALYCETGRQRDEYIITYFTVVLFFGTMLFDIYLLIKYANQFDETMLPFMVSLWTTLSFYLIGLVLHIGFVNRNLKIEEPKLDQLFAIIIGVGVGFSTTFLNAALNQIRFSVLPYEYYVFFLTVAVAEEILWRAGFQPAFKILFNFVVMKRKTGELYTIEEENILVSRLLSSGISILVSAGLFTVFHIFVYEDPTQLLIIFIMGIIFGILVEITHRIDVAIVAHLVVNIVGGLALITTLFGGF